MTTKLPSRLHHTAYVSSDLEATRHFYEDIIGLPLSACWTEIDHLFGKDRTYCHLFFDLADGSALAFFQFADPEDQALFGPELPPSPFRHIALCVDKETQAGIEERIQKAGIQPPKTYALEHGYCRSVYVEDPDGMIVEFTCDDPRAASGAEERKAKAHAELKRWLDGDHSNNNPFRHEEAA
ncbi:VOC family protein [Alteraurantiacibacter aquimixticola]|uniref:VOC family protein n=1 Tax=Alteraurantiacibacter aquimixticola TaxID=2489173 RepID=A0A4T3EY88_9SPHN|nr:VOC family protein [Alteraurantiacibacter aquimixticola]TIX49021.1 VOC family protein [Alteraurantiacibacter aquimixticola]